MAGKAIWRSIGQWAVVVFGLLLPALASAAPAPVYPPRLCIRTADVAESPYRLLATPAAFNCTRSPAGAVGHVTWGLIDGLALDNDPHDPWQVRHEYSQARSEVLYVRYADGRIVKAPSDRRSARRLFSPALASFVLPAQPGRIVAILIGIEGLQNQHGVAPGLVLETARAELDADLPVLFLYALMAGVIIALLLYNFAFYVALGYRFILCYCLSALSILALGLCWSGGIFLLVPGMDTTEQISWTMLGTMVSLGCSALFMVSFIEGHRLPRRWARFTLTMALVGITSCVLRLVDVEFAWNIVDRVTYGSVAAVLAAMMVTAGIAAQRGSRSARVYVLAWTIPLILCIVRAIWGMGFLGGSYTLVAMSPLILMVIEAMMSALAVSWQVGRLRSERDEARAKQIELRTLSETDPLTGLLNRRAFIDHARSDPHGDVLQRLILLDIDQFKLVNDRHGHQAGDDVLLAVADALRATVPPQAIVGRIGGEEFGVLVPAEPLDVLADRLCKAIACARTSDGLSVTISAGVADGRIAGDADWRLLYYAADHALYRSKNGGRNQVSHAPKALAA